MSYEKVRSIKIDEKKGEVWINSACNNVRPLDYSPFCYPTFSKILKEKGKSAVEIEILKTYESGSFQQGVNKFTKALKVLRYVFGEEYKRFNWRNKPWGDEKKSKEIEDLRESKEFDDLLIKCLKYKFSKTKFIITKENFGEVIYARVCPTCIKWARFKEKATKFDFEEEAKDNIYNAYKDDWKVEEFKSNLTKLKEVLA